MRRSLSSDAAITERAIDAVMKKGYGFDAERMRIVGEKIASGDVDPFGGIDKAVETRYNKKRDIKTLVKKNLQC